jgi:hypothetical protein
MALVICKDHLWIEKLLNLYIHDSDNVHHKSQLKKLNNTDFNVAF